MRDAVARVHDQGGIAIVAHPLVPYPLCASGAHHPPAAGRGRRRVTTRTPSRRSTRRRRGCAGARRVPDFVDGGRPGAGGRHRDAHRADAIGPARDALPGRAPRTTCARPSWRATTAWEGEAYAWPEQLGMFRRQTAQERPRRSATRSAARSGATAPVATWAIPAARSAGPLRRARPAWPTRSRREDRPRHALHLPAAGRRQRARPRALREPRRARPRRAHHQQHPRARSARARATSSAWATAGACPPTGRSAPSPSPIGTASWSRRCWTGSGSTSSTSTSRSCPSCRSRCCGTRSGVNVATFHAYSGWSPSYEFGKRMMARFASRLHGRIAVSAAARHFISRYFPGEYKVIPNGVDLRDYRDVTPFARWRDGTPNILFIGRFESRKGADVPAQGVPPRCGARAYDCRLLLVGARAAGARGAALHRHAAARRASSCWGACRDADKARAFATADVFVSPATGQESFGIVLLEAMAAGAPIVCSRHPRLQGRRAARRAGAAGAAQGRRRRWRAPSGSCCATRRCARGWATPAQGARGAVQLAQRDGQGGRLLRLRHPAAGGHGALPPGFRAPIPGPPARPAQAPLLWSSTAPSSRPSGQDGSSTADAEATADAVTTDGAALDSIDESVGAGGGPRGRP